MTLKNEKILKHAMAKDFSFYWEGALHQTEITLQIPDFNQNNFKVWGDWGPMYEVQLNAEKPIKISYKDMNSNQIDEYFLEQKTFELNTPILADERKKFPLIMSLFDERKGFKYQLSLNKESDIKKVEVFRKEDSVILFSTEISKP